MLTNINITLLQNDAACVNEYFDDSDTKEKQERSSEDPIYKGYKAVLDSKSTDETLVSSLLVSLMYYLNLALQYCLWLIVTINFVLCRHYMQVGSQGIRGTVTDFRGSNM